jgi:hypothetical protein
MGELGPALGIKWKQPRTRQFDSWTIRVVFSDGWPFVELIEGQPGGPWDTAPGNRLDTLAYWSDDLQGDRQRLADAGLSMSIDGSQYGATWTYHSTQHCGLRVALVDHAAQGEFLSRY